MGKVTSADIQRYGVEEMAKRPRGPSMLEQGLWELAASSPYGGKVIEANAANDPYLLRTYMTPTRENIRKYFSDVVGVRSQTLLAAVSIGRCYLHYFFRGDEDREVHNHPFARSASLILVNGYQEFRWKPAKKAFDVRYMTPGKVNLIGRNDYHRVELFDGQGCWTLFVSLGRVMESNGHDWNFMNTATGEKIPWGDWSHH